MLLVGGKNKTTTEKKPKQNTLEEIKELDFQKGEKLNSKTSACFFPRCGG